MNPFYIIWIVLTIPASLWVAHGNPDYGFIANVFWGGCIGFIATAGAIACYGQIWIGFHTNEIIDEVCDGLFYNNRKGK